MLKPVMRVFKNKPFARFARKGGVSDSDLCKSIEDADRGLIAADLGGGVIKMRIARQGAGKSSGFRVLILFKVHELSIFVHGFAKNEAENIRQDELVALKKLAVEMLAYPEDAVEKAVLSGTLIEVQCNGESESIPQ